MAGRRGVWMILVSTVATPILLSAAPAATMAATGGGRMAATPALATNATETGLVELTNGTLVVTIVPALGGRVVSLKTRSGENLLDSDPALWKPPYPAASLDTPFQPRNGRIVWVGPQSAFWSQQELRPDRKTTKAVWPPDPFNETGRFEVVERTPTLLRLKGGVSPVSGLGFEHEFELTGERTIRMKTTATNGRATPVAWDLWPNTRVRPEGHPYVPIDPMQMLRVGGPPQADSRLGPYPNSMRNGWLTLAPGKKPGDFGRKKLWSKVYVRPAHGLIAYFLGRQLLLIRAPLVPRQELHGEQAAIEVYRSVDKKESLLELEMHGPYETLAPGASMSFEQTFELLDYEGPQDEDGHLARLQELR